MPRSNTSAIAKWTDDTEIVSVTLILRAISDIELSSNYTTAFHAWFLHQVRDSDPQLSAYLHDGQSEKAFAISPLNGNLIANTFLAKVDSTYTWTISALSNTLCTWLKTWYINHPETINLYKGNFEIEQININQPPTT
ncbi:MAG: CRISPR-associated endoribonuclease Cas6, partial [Pseudanabaena sp.]